MTKEPTKADLLKTIKKQDTAVRKLMKALNFEKDKFEASQAVAVTLQHRIAELEKRPTFNEIYSGKIAPSTKLPWDCLPNPYEGTK